jgi:hypothetical protein
VNTDVPPDIRPRQEPERTAPGADELAAAWNRLEQRYRETEQGTRLSHLFAGALCAARWTQGYTAEAPMTGRLCLYDGSTFLSEVAVADPVVWGQRSDLNRDYARGVSAWLWWVEGTQPRPAWLR